ncbi:amidohydrolase family protein [Pleionea sp. CnH1-48]|uniref:amidohydrolase family protein n=1 Tax=Pleionea sp. CnH1-48 TaxID=2954494 RepID=UPI0020969DAA|nr:amidohydrolase family protein [Pleionea sp. CnH1-48]MCO7224590.1 amidohydrolase family protein [Pleionea sp. CnH1-48]
MRLLITLLMAFAITSHASQLKHQQNDNSFILNNVNVVDVENHKIHPSRTLIVKNGKIDNILDSGSPINLTDLPIIEGKNGYITPGLIDMHVHMYEKAAYTLALNHGVTHVRIMNGLPSHLAWRHQVESGSLIGSSSTVSSPIISGFDKAYLHHTVHTAEEARDAVRQYQSKGYDLIKAYGNLNKAALSALIKESRKVGIPVAKHGPHGSGDMPFSQLSSLQSFEHVEDIYQGPLNYNFDLKRLQKVIPELKATGVPVTPTLNIFYQLTKLSQEKEKYLAKTSSEYTSDIIALETSNNQLKRWLTASDNMAAHNQKTLNFLLVITKALHDAEVPLLIGSDSGVLLSPHGLALHNEMRLFQKAGLSTFDVLAAATINAAKALKLDKKIGKVSPQYNADFIYSSSNPINNLSVLKEPEAVVKNGYWHSRQALNIMRDKAIESRSLWEELHTLFDGL